MNCECCHERPATSWFCLDDNAEVELCDECAADLAEHGMDVEAFE